MIRAHCQQQKWRPPFCSRGHTWLMDLESPSITYPQHVFSLLSMEICQGRVNLLEKQKILFSDTKICGSGIFLFVSSYPFGLVSLHLFINTAHYYILHSGTSPLQKQVKVKKKLQKNTPALDQISTKGKYQLTLHICLLLKQKPHLSDEIMPLVLSVVF